MKGILTNISKAADSGFRRQANSVEVVFESYPTVGQRFNCLGKGVEFGVRLVSTSPVERIVVENGVVQFSTETGSVYKLTVSSNEPVDE